MSAEHRRVEVAPGHAVTVYRAPRQSGREGFVTVAKSHRPPFDVCEERWQAAPVVRR